MPPALIVTDPALLNVPVGAPKEALLLILRLPVAVRLDRPDASEPADTARASLHVKLRTESATAKECVMVTGPGRLMVTSSLAVGRVPLLQLAAVSQSPPLTLIQLIAAGAVRSSRISIPGRRFRPRLTWARALGRARESTAATNCRASVGTSSLHIPREAQAFQLSGSHTLTQGCEHFAQLPGLAISEGEFSCASVPLAEVGHHAKTGWWSSRRPALNQTLA